MVKDLFIDLSKTPVILDGYVEKEVVDDKTYIKATTTFSDDEFSDNDITVMDDILRRYGKKTAKQLVELTHRKDGLWYATAKRNNLLEGFEQKVINNSDCQIDLGECLADCGREFYNEQMDFLKMTRGLWSVTSDFARELSFISTSSSFLTEASQSPSTSLC